MPWIYSAIFICLLATPVFAQDPIGARLVPSTGIVMFNAPPNGAFQSAPTAQAIIQPGIAGNTLFPLQPDGTAPSGYSVTGQTLATPPELVVTGYVDVYQDKALNRWVEVAPMGNATAPGWVLWGEVGQPAQGFTVIPKGGN